MLRQQALNTAMMEAVEFVHAEGWDEPPTLFALVPSELVVDQLEELERADNHGSVPPLTLVVQDLPESILPGSGELADYIARATWPQQVAGVILAQEIVFRDTAEASAGGDPRQARLFSGVLREVDADDAEIEQTLLQIRPTEAELEEGGLFAHDDIELRGGPNVAPQVLAALRYSLSHAPDEID